MSHGRMSTLLIKTDYARASGAQPCCGRALRATISKEDTMKMVKSTLLSGVASLMSVAAAQPADLPVKSKAVEYVRICSMYGLGFYYIHGTDTCIKIGGYLRFEVDHNAGGTFSPGVSPGGSAAQHIWGFDRTSRSEEHTSELQS